MAVFGVQYIIFHRYRQGWYVERCEYWTNGKLAREHGVKVAASGGAFIIWMTYRGTYEA